MILKNLIKLLDENNNAPIHIMLPSGEFVPEHFHITEVGLIEKTFIDCGGTLRITKSCSLQVWTAHDTEHRLNTNKLTNILNLSKKTLRCEELTVEIEYGNNVISQYFLNNVEITPKGLLFVLTGKKTDCLAPDKCGINNKCC